ncbi:MAG TPA: DUF177 domain-containing protein [Longimicrobiales bacterium]|nr:DUF177 domain-containing protein [Longimicrobiales bacterium]
MLVQARVPADDAVWQDSGIEWDRPVEVSLRASYAGSGEVVVRGNVSGQLLQQCRRCLQPVVAGFDEDVTLVFVSKADGRDTDEGDAIEFDPRAGFLDLSEAVREEVILAVNLYVVCDPGCLGLCPRCGTNLNEGACGCAENGGDPRWEALRALKGR